MKNEPIKVIIFALYTWFIYNLYLFVTGPLFIYMVGYENWELFALGVFCLWGAIGALILPPHWTILILIPVAIFFSIFNILQFITWWQKPTLLKAWILSMSGAITLPGALAFVGVLDKRGPIVLVPVLVALSLFYLALYLADCLQKDYFPNNRLANRIRYILQWPCLNLPRDKKEDPCN